MRICIVAEHASTRFGGEAILPIHYFRLLRARGIEAWLVVHARTRDELAELFAEDMSRIRFVPDMWIHRTLYSLCCRLPRRLSEATLGLLNQLITQFCQRTLVRDLVREEGIEIVHQPIPVSPRFPSALYGLGVPVVIGPLNGGMEYPPAFHHAEPWITRAAVAMAKLFVDIANTLIPGKKRADVVLVANERTRAALPAVRGRVIELVENGIDAEMWRSTNSPIDSESHRFVFLGRMVDWKRVDIVIRALAQVPLAELEIIGDGPMSEPCRALAHELGVQDRVFFAGWVPQQECPARLQSALALVLPSIYECGGAVVLEAMAMGKPVIATRWGGPADYLNDSCGILVDPDSEASMVAGFADAMKQLIHSPGLARAMGIAGQQRAHRDFDWRPKIDYVLSIYRSLLPGETASMETQDEEAEAIAVAERG